MDETERRRAFSRVTSRALASFAGGLQVRGDYQPARFDRHQILRLIDWRSDHAVFIAHDQLLDRRVILELFAAADVEELFVTARKLATVSSPSIAAFYVAEEIDGVPCLVRELIEGPPLSSWVATQRWPERLAAYLRAGEGLAAAHQAGVVQLHFSPERVVVGADGRVCIRGFGQARDEGEFVVAPEQRRGEPGDHRSDQFRFCASLWAALFGRLPAATDDELDATVPATVVAALTRGLATDPSQRFPSMEELLAALGPKPLGRVADELRVALANGRRIFEIGLAMVVTAALAFTVAARQSKLRDSDRTLAEVGIEAFSRDYNPASELATALVLEADAAEDPEATARRFSELADCHASEPENFDIVWRTGFGVAELLSSSARAALVQGEDQRARVLFRASDAVFVRLLAELDGDANGRRAAMALQGRAVLLRSYGRLEHDWKRLVLARSLEQASVARWYAATPLELDPYQFIEAYPVPLACEPVSP